MPSDSWSCGVQTRACALKWFTSCGSHCLPVFAVSVHLNGEVITQPLYSPAAPLRVWDGPESPPISISQSALKWPLFLCLNVAPSIIWEYSRIYLSLSGLFSLNLSAETSSIWYVCNIAFPPFLMRSDFCLVQRHKILSERSILIILDSPQPCSNTAEDSILFILPLGSLIKGSDKNNIFSL